MKPAFKIMFAAVALATAGIASADYTVSVNRIDARGQLTPAGEVKITSTDKGVIFTPALKGLPPGEHGFHVHANASCDPASKDNKMQAGEAAGPHYDPQNANKHAGAKGPGHMGDLPALVVGPEGDAIQAVTAPRLNLAELKGHSLMIHAGGDNHTDKPANGGGGDRIACGVIL